MRGLDVPERTEDFTADPVELFFDLGFVFAFSQLVYHLVHHPTWTGGAEALLLFAVLWMAWSVFTWSANAVSGNSRPTRLVFVVATAVAVPLGASVTHAFDSGGLTFAICASLLVVLGIALQAWGHERGSAELRSVIQFGSPNLVGVLILIAGGLFEGRTRVVLWIVFVVVMFASTIAANRGVWIVRPGHFAERHGLIIIIALGELIVAIGISVVTSLDETAGLPNQTLISLIAAGALAGLLWWSYFDRVLPALEHRGELLEGRDRSVFARDIYTFLHLPIVFGIIVSASAVEEILLHPKDPVPPEFRVMLAAGMAMVFLGVIGAAYRAFQAVAYERFAITASLIALVALASNWSGLTVIVVADALILVGLVAEHLRIEHPAEST